MISGARIEVVVLVAVRHDSGARQDVLAVRHDKLRAFGFTKNVLAVRPLRAFGFSKNVLAVRPLRAFGTRQDVLAVHHDKLKL